MSAATFTFDVELELFLPREYRGATIVHAYAHAATMKQAIEALGVPHTEIGRISVNGSPATLDRTVREGDCIAVFAHPRGDAPFETPLAPAAAQTIAHKVPERVQQQHSQFMHCPGCDRVYWEGSHWDRMRSVLARTLGVSAVE